MIDMVVSYAPLASLLFFFCFFVSMVAWIVRPGTKALYKECAQIPLQETSHD